MPEFRSDYEIVVIAQEIRDYLVTHPNAADSLEGVVKWWLRRRQYEESTKKVKEALDYLIDKGIVIEKRTPGTNMIYVLHRHITKEEE